MSWACSQLQPACFNLGLGEVRSGTSYAGFPAGRHSYLHKHTHTNATSLQSWPSWLRRGLPGGRERKEGKGLYKSLFSNPRSAAAFRSSVRPLGTVGRDLLILEPSYNVEHQLRRKHFARCSTLWFSVEGRWDGMLEKEVGCLPRLYIVLKNDK